jgi:nucleolar protein 56
LLNIDTFTIRVLSLFDYRKELQSYLHEKMNHVAPNLAALIGDVVGARLICHAGSLTNLAKYPASTVQILGAEKALFRYVDYSHIIFNFVARSRPRARRRNTD